jgi:hypothetical protein
LENRNGLTPLTAQHDPATPARDEIVERSLLPTASETADPGEIATRGAWNRDLMGKPLSEVRKVHAQIVGENSSSQEFLTQLRERLAEGSRLQLSDSEQADAALKISVRPASARAGDRRVIVIVRAANANGYVVWPDSRSGLSWRYVGQPRYVAQRLVADLNNDIQRAKPR